HRAPVRLLLATYLPLLFAEVQIQRRIHMKRKISALAPLVAASGLALLLSSAVYAQPVTEYHFRTDRISAQGEVTSIAREGDQYRVVLNNGMYAYLVPMSSVHN